MSSWAAFTLIILCTLLWDAGVVLQKLAVDRIPTIRLGPTFTKSIGTLLGSRRWMLGLAASAFGWALFAYALVYTPVSMARAIQGSGFVVLALFSKLFLSHRLSAREWAGVALVTAGIIALGVASGAGNSPAADYSLAKMGFGLAASVVAFGVAGLLPGASRRASSGALVFSARAGILLGVGDVATKVLIMAVRRGTSSAEIIATGLILILFYVTGFIMLSRSYQEGRAILVSAVSDLSSRVVVIGIGFVALGELPTGDASLRAFAFLGYGMLFAGVALLSRYSVEGLAEGLAASGAYSAAGRSKLLDIPDETKAAAGTEIDAKP